MATRTSGVGASARNLIFVGRDPGFLAHRQQQHRRQPAFRRRRAAGCQRIDVLYGPFSARYAGNSIGATINITTRMPDHFELYADALGAVQDFQPICHRLHAGHLADCRRGIGDRYGAFSWRLSANHLDSTGQPLGLCHPDAARQHQHRRHGADRRLQ